MLTNFESYLASVWAPELGLNSQNAHEILLAMQAFMAEDSASVQKNTVSVGTVTADAENAGDGSAIVFGKTAIIGDVVDDERIRTQDARITCNLDSAHNNRQSGNEQFVLNSEYDSPAVIPVIAATEGDTSDAFVRNRLMDGGFESYDADFEYWDVVSGASVFSQETSTVFRGESALKIDDDGVTAAELEQDLTQLSPALKSSEFYVLAANVYVSSITAGSVKLRLEGDSYISDAEIELNSGTDTGSWLKAADLELLPKSIPDNLAFKIVVSADFNGTVYLDNLGLAEPQNIKEFGAQIALFQGDKDFVAGKLPDFFDFSITSNDAGVFQTFFRKYYSIVMPSAASPTISDDYAT
ncbi:MAG: hypothetical protein K8S87_01705 [Planctomycetes bacterium]|nr:hypothetical protein [Planctomycetota bacterium]